MDAAPLHPDISENAPAAFHAPVCSGVSGIAEKGRKRKIQKNSAYGRKGLLIEIFQKEAESQNNRKPKCYNDAAMKKKPQIGYNHEAKQFEQDEKPLTYDEALEIFNAGSGDWSNQAYWIMSQIVMGRAQQPV